MTTTVSYHADPYSSEAHPAVNIKVHAPGSAFRSPAVDESMPAETERIHDEAYELVQSDFFQAAEEMAAQYGLGAMFQEGRSGGWLAFTDYGADDELDADWLAAYSTFQDWAHAECDAAPGRVADLARRIAMDELGSRAISQPFNYERNGI